MPEVPTGILLELIRIVQVHLDERPRPQRTIEKYSRLINEVNMSLAKPTPHRDLQQATLGAILGCSLLGALYGVYRLVILVF